MVNRMDVLIFCALMLIAVFFLNLAWVVFCVQRGADKTRGQRREREVTGLGMRYSMEELYDIGNPLSRYKGRSNW